MNFVVIVNKNGLLSAAPTQAAHEAGNYVTHPSLMLVFYVKIHAVTYGHLYKNRDNAYVLADGLPVQDTTDPFREYYHIDNGWLKRA